MPGPLSESWASALLGRAFLEEGTSFLRLSAARVATTEVCETGDVDDPGAGRLVGRDLESAMLARALDRGLAGRSGLVLVSGEAGIGKTTLVENLTGAARRRHVPVLHSQADERDPSAFGLWRGPALRLNVDLIDLDWSLPAAEHRWELLGELTDAIDGAGPLCMVLEDLQWADELSLWILERLSASLAGWPVVMVATCRDAGPAQPVVPALRPAVVVRLSGLTTVEVAELAADLRPGYELDADELRRRTGGNPPFIREVLALASEGGRVPPVVSHVLRRSLQTFDPVCLSGPRRLGAGGNRRTLHRGSHRRRIVRR